MLALPVLTWVRFLVWLDIGMLIYWFYGRTPSPLSNEAEAAARTGAQKTGQLSRCSACSVSSTAPPCRARR